MALRKAFEIDLNKCDGCDACRIACTIENNLELERSWRSVYTFNEKKIPELSVYHFSLGCNHCETAPCLENCPSLAFSRNNEFGSVVLDSKKCIGCKYCEWQCPYNAPKYNPYKQYMEKCTFCVDRLIENKNPACVVACPLNALKVIDLEENSNSEYPKGFIDIGINPSIKIINKRNGSPRSSSSEMTTFKIIEKKEDTFFSKIRSEYQLAIFTFIATFLVSWFSTSVTKNRIVSDSFFVFSLLSFWFAFSHLGQKLKAFRAILNWKNSWISKEIIFYSIFIGISIIYFKFFRNAYLGYVNIVFGLLTLFSIDMIYKTRSRIFFPLLHSGETILTGFFLYGLFANNIFLYFGVLKVILYLYETINIRHLNNQRIVLIAVRVLFGFVFPVILWVFGSRYVYFYVLLGEFINRIEFYLDLEFVKPTNQNL